MLSVMYVDVVCVTANDGWQSCSDDDDVSEDGSWIDVVHSSDDEQTVRTYSRL